MLKEELLFMQTPKNQLTLDTLENSVLKTKKDDLSLLDITSYMYFFQFCQEFIGKSKLTTEVIPGQTHFKPFNDSSFFLPSVNKNKNMPLLNYFYLCYSLANGYLS